MSQTVLIVLLYLLISLASFVSSANNQVEIQSHTRKAALRCDTNKAVQGALLFAPELKQSQDQIEIQYWLSLKHCMGFNNVQTREVSPLDKVRFFTPFAKDLRRFLAWGEISSSRSIDLQTRADGELRRWIVQILQSTGFKFANLPKMLGRMNRSQLLNILNRYLDNTRSIDETVRLAIVTVNFSVNDLLTPHDLSLLAQKKPVFKRIEVSVFANERQEPTQVTYFLRLKIQREDTVDGSVDRFTLE